MQQFRAYTAGDRSIYQPLNQAIIDAYDGKQRAAIQHLKRFSENDHYHYWILLFIEKDPILTELKALPAFRETIQTIERKFWERHARIRKRLEQQQLI